MEQLPGCASHEVDMSRPSAARCYDFFLGGAHNFAVDRELGRKLMRIIPNIPEIAQNNRAFLRRAVRYCVDQGIRQFLDLGSGIPTVGNVHEIVQQVAPESRVVYVDKDPVAVAHSRTILEGNDRAAVVRANLLDVEDVLRAPETVRMIDFSQPVAVVMVAVVHFLPEAEQPGKVIRRYYERLAPGSFLGFSHVTGDDCPTAAQALVDVYEENSDPVTLRSRHEIAALLSDFRLVDSGVVYLPEWRPDTHEDIWDEPEQSIVYGAVGRKV